MSIYDLERRTKTYTAGDWDGDKDAIDQLHKWNSSNYWGLHFVDVHEFTSSSDYSLNCSIKRSLRERMSKSKRFVLIVGNKTNTVRSGLCSYCIYNYTQGLFCSRNMVKDNRSYIQYECDLAKNSFQNGDLDIVVLYNSINVNRNLCPDMIRWSGTHVAMKHVLSNGYNNYIDWNYNTVKEALK